MDWGAVAWTLSWSFNLARGSGSRRVLAVAAWPIWVVTVMLLPGFVHADRKVVARLTRRTTGAMLFGLARVLAFAVLVGVPGGVVLGWVFTLVPWWLSVPLLLAVAGWAGTGAVVVLAVLMSRLEHVQRVETAARRAQPSAQRKADRAARRRADWAMDSVASRLPRGGLALVGEHARRTVPSGQTITAEAATDQHVAVYRRYGFVPLATAPFKMLATV